MEASRRTYPTEVRAIARGSMSLWKFRRACAVHVGQPTHDAYLLAMPCTRREPVDRGKVDSIRNILEILRGLHMYVGQSTHYSLAMRCHVGVSQCSRHGQEHELVSILASMHGASLPTQDIGRYAGVVHGATGQLASRPDT